MRPKIPLEGKKVRSWGCIQRGAESLCGRRSGDSGFNLQPLPDAGRYVGMDSYATAAAIAEGIIRADKESALRSALSPSSQSGTQKRKAKNE